MTTDGSGNATIPLFAAATGQFVTATATDSSNNTSEFSTCVPAAGRERRARRDRIADSPDPVVVGGQLSYTVTVTNNGPSPATNVRLSALWNGPFNVDATGPAGTCELTPLLVCSFGTLASGATATLGIVGTPTAIGLLGNTITVQADQTDPVPANNAVAVNTAVVGGPSSFVVTNTNNTGDGSLRQAILNANASAGADVISFAILAAGVQTITLASTLPSITDPVTIDGTTQPGFAGTPLIELNGNGIAGNGLNIAAGNTTIRGLAINRFAGSGILITASATNAVIQGNYIGTNATGTAALANGTGVTIGGAGNTVGGTTPQARNLISGNLGSGVTVQGAASSGNVVLGNFIGTNAAGTAAIPNQGIQSGVFILNAPGNTIGGTAAGAGNVISGNAQHALTIVGATATGNLVQGNFVGTAADGATPLGNGGIGIDIVSAPGNTVGGTGTARNLVAHNQTGMQIRTGADNNIVRNNSITSNSGVAVRIDDTSGNTIGGLVTGDGNTIQNNGTGIVVLTATSARNAILGNSISGNAFLGIDIDQDGVTANDATDVDSGPNGRQNFPVLTAAAGGVQGTLNSTPNATYRIEFFGNTACDASGNGEGATFLGAHVSHDRRQPGNATIPLFAATAGQAVTATATDSSNNTSEFSACVQTTEAPVITLTATDADAAELGGNTGTVIVTRSGATTLDRDVADLARWHLVPPDRLHHQQPDTRDVGARRLHGPHPRRPDDGDRDLDADLQSPGRRS